MQQHGSLYNHLMSQTAATPDASDPNVGDGATIAHWSDREACTVISVERRGKFVYVTVQEDFRVRTDKNGMSCDQSYDYTPNPKGSTTTFRRKVEVPANAYKAWRHCWKDPDTGRWNQASPNGGPSVGFGYRRAYHDYSF